MFKQFQVCTVHVFCDDGTIAWRTAGQAPHRFVISCTRRLTRAEQSRAILNAGILPCEEAVTKLGVVQYYFIVRAPRIMIDN